LYGLWQTEAWEPPPAVDGKVPRNEHGNVEVPPFAKSLPKGETCAVLELNTLCHGMTWVCWHVCIVVVPPCARSLPKGELSSGLQDCGSARVLCSGRAGLLTLEHCSRLRISMAMWRCCPWPSL
jgi:hypothetical protein